MIYFAQRQLGIDVLRTVLVDKAQILWNRH